MDDLRLRSVNLLGTATALLLLPLLALMGCGGGGGGSTGISGGPVAGLVGDYQAVYLQHDHTIGRVFSVTARYRGAADGTLTGVEAFGVSDLFVGAGPLVPADLTWTVAAGRQLNIPMLGGGGLIGTIAPDGSFATGGEAVTGNPPLAMLMLRMHPAPTLEDLFGEWWMLTINKPPTAVLRSEVSEVSVDLTGGTIRGAGFENVDGVLTRTLAGIPTGRLSIGPDGVVEFDLGVGAKLVGGLSERGDVLLLGASTGPAGVQMRVLVRRDVGVRPEAANRTWGGVAGFGTPGTGYLSAFGSGEIAGLPTDQLTVTYNADGLLTMPNDVVATLLPQSNTSLNGALGPSNQLILGALARREPFAFISLVEPGQEPLIFWMIE